MRFSGVRRLAAAFTRGACSMRQCPGTHIKTPLVSSFEFPVASFQKTYHGCFAVLTMFVPQRKLSRDLWSA
ncbi:MAG: hypothetical protein FWH21_10335, partial [Kiritimatiellaeota bacterium]|nr:hypothetical protein [Kiritimatiellota bacterium]